MDVSYLNLIESLLGVGQFLLIVVLAVALLIMERRSVYLERRVRVLERIGREEN